MQFGTVIRVRGRMACFMGKDEAEHTVLYPSIRRVHPCPYSNTWSCLWYPVPSRPVAGVHALDVCNQTISIWL
jgi:hypothetical protein